MWVCVCVASLFKCGNVNWSLIDFNDCVCVCGCRLFHHITFESLNGIHFYEQFIRFSAKNVHQTPFDAIYIPIGKQTNPTRYNETTAKWIHEIPNEPKKKSIKWECVPRVTDSFKFALTIGTATLFFFFFACSMHKWTMDFVQFGNGKSLENWF